MPIRTADLFLFLLLLLIQLVAGCARFQPTRYDEGISVAAGVSTFRGNSHTSKNQAAWFSKLGAVNACEQEDKLAYLGTENDQSIERTYTRMSVSSYTVPGYTTFNGNTYLDHSKSSTSTSAYSYPVTDTYPVVATPFRCIPKYNVVLQLKSYEPISRELVHPYSKDFKGGLLVKEANVFKEIPRCELREKDIILAVNGRRVETLSEYTFEVMPLVSGSHANFKIVRNEKIRTVRVPVYNGADYLIGLGKDVIAEACALAKKQKPLARVCTYRESAEQQTVKRDILPQ